MTIAAACCSTGTSLTALTVEPWIETTETLLPSRLAINARSPFLEIDRPDGCRPTVTVSINFGGLAVRSITYSLLSGTDFQELPSWTWTTELATRPSLPSGVICRLVGGP